MNDLNSVLLEGVLLHDLILDGSDTVDFTIACINRDRVINVKVQAPSRILRKAKKGSQLRCVGYLNCIAGTLYVNATHVEFKGGM